MKYAWIGAQRRDFGLDEMCRVLESVRAATSRGGSEASCIESD